MRKRPIALLMVVALLASSVSPVFAQGGQPSCVGGAVRVWAWDPGPFGQGVRELAEYHHPFGRVVARIATACQFPEE